MSWRRSISGEWLTVANLVTSIVLRRKYALLHGSAHPVVRGRAVPLDLSESRPFEAALCRNIQAAIGHSAAP
jgi:hypothetical protein